MAPPPPRSSTGSQPQPDRVRPLGIQSRTLSSPLTRGEINRPATSGKGVRRKSYTSLGASTRGLSRKKYRGAATACSNKTDTKVINKQAEKCNDNKNITIINRKNDIGNGSEKRLRFLEVNCKRFDSLPLHPNDELKVKEHSDMFPLPKSALVTRVRSISQNTRYKDTSAIESTKLGLSQRNGHESIQSGIQIIVENNDKVTTENVIDIVKRDKPVFIPVNPQSNPKIDQKSKQDGKIIKTTNRTAFVGNSTSISNSQEKVIKENKELIIQQQQQQQLSTQIINCGMYREALPPIDINIISIFNKIVLELIPNNISFETVGLAAIEMYDMKMKHIDLSQDDFVGTTDNINVDCSGYAHLHSVSRNKAFPLVVPYKKNSTSKLIIKLPCSDKFSSISDLKYLDPCLGVVGDLDLGVILVWNLTNGAKTKKLKVKYRDKILWCGQLKKGTDKIGKIIKKATVIWLTKSTTYRKKMKEVLVKQYETKKSLPPLFQTKNTTDVNNLLKPSLQIKQTTGKIGDKTSNNNNNNNNATTTTTTASLYVKKVESVITTALSQQLENVTPTSELKTANFQKKAKKQKKKVSTFKMMKKIIRKKLAGNKFLTVKDNLTMRFLRGWGEDYFIGMNSILFIDEKGHIITDVDAEILDENYKENTEVQSNNNTNSNYEIYQYLRNRNDNKKEKDIFNPEQVYFGPSSVNESDIRNITMNTRNIFTETSQCYNKDVNTLDQLPDTVAKFSSADEADDDNLDSTSSTDDKSDSTTEYEYEEESKGSNEDYTAQDQHKTETTHQSRLTSTNKILSGLVVNVATNWRTFRDRDMLAHPTGVVFKFKQEVRIKGMIVWNYIKNNCVYDRSGNLVDDSGVRSFVVFRDGVPLEHIYSLRPFRSSMYVYDNANAISLVKKKKKVCTELRGIKVGDVVSHSVFQHERVLEPVRILFSYNDVLFPDNVFCADLKIDILSSYNPCVNSNNNNSSNTKSKSSSPPKVHLKSFDIIDRSGRAIPKELIKNLSLTPSGTLDQREGWMFHYFGCSSEDIQHTYFPSGYVIGQIHLEFKHVVPVGGLVFKNSAKHGVKDVCVYADSCIVFMGRLNRVEQAQVVPFSSTREVITCNHESIYNYEVNSCTELTNKDYL